MPEIRRPLPPLPGFPTRDILGQQAQGEAARVWEDLAAVVLILNLLAGLDGRRGG